jgi:2-polyprenyl-3-methyl-5-hydroxy-6-metoxy-1,4-benzoquinol methylase
MGDVRHRIYERGAWSEAVKTRREVALRPAMLRIADRMTLMSGTIEFPSLPGLLEHATQRVVGLFASLGRPCSQDGINSLRTLIKRAMEEGYQKSADARVVVAVEAPEGKAANYEVGLRILTTEERYKTMQAIRPPPLFGKVPDAMVLNTAGSLGEASQTRVLDVGAGTGRNAIPLAGLGHPVTAVEGLSEFAEQLRTVATESQLPISVVDKDFLAPETLVESGAYRLVVVSEVLTHFRRVENIRAAFSKFADALSPGGVVVANAFVASHWYKPDPLAKQIGEMCWSCFYTPAELNFITAELPFEKIADEPALDYEREHLSKEDWPPTTWFENWANGRNVFETNPGMSAPIELRWLVFRRLP